MVAEFEGKLWIWERKMKTEIELMAIDIITNSLIHFLCPETMKDMPEVYGHYKFAAAHIFEQAQAYIKMNQELSAPL